MPLSPCFILSYLVLSCYFILFNCPLLSFPVHPVLSYCFVPFVVSCPAPHQQRSHSQHHQRPVLFLLLWSVLLFRPFLIVLFLLVPPCPVIFLIVHLYLVLSSSVLLYCLLLSLLSFPHHRVMCCNHPSAILSVRNWFDWLQRDKKAPPPCLLSNHSLPWDSQVGLTTSSHQTGLLPAGVREFLQWRRKRG